MKAATLGLLTLLIALPARAQTIEVPNGSFEDDGGWVLEQRGGAEGEMAYATDPARSGRRSLRLTKTNAVGALVLRMAAPVALGGDTRYRVRGWFHADDAPLASLLLFRMAAPGAETLAYNAIDRSAGWPSQSLIINTPPGEWHKRVVHQQPRDDQALALHIVLYGNPTTVWLDDIEITAEPFKMTSERPDPPTPYTDAQVDARLAERPELTATVSGEGGRSRLLINGEAVVPALYKAATGAQSRDYAGMGAAGVDLVVLPIKLGGVRNEPGIWLGAGQYDFSPLESEIRTVLRRNPEARLIIDFWAYPYLSWGEEHPDEVWRDVEGKGAYGWWGNVEGFTDDLTTVTPERPYWWYPSYHSRLWREESGAAVRAAVEWLRGSPYGKAVVGFFLTGGHDGQFQMLSQGDHSPAALAAWHDWLRAEYGTPEALAAAWGEAIARFEDVPPPTLTAADAARERETPYVAPNALIDFRRFGTDAAWGLKDHYAGIAEEAIGKPVFSVSYGDPASGYEVDGFLKLEHLDATASMSTYPYRNVGYALGYRPQDSFARHDKLFFQELDIRSWTGSVYNDEVYQQWIGAGLDADEWRAVQRKLVGVSLAQGHGFWYYDMGYYFAAPEIQEEIGRTMAVAQQVYGEPGVPFRPDVCVVRAAGSDPFLRVPLNAVSGGEKYQLMALEQSGVPYDLHYLDDVLADPGLQDYKVYVFLHTRWLSDAQRAGIEALKADGRTLVWLADPGYITPAGPSIEALSALVGMNVATEPVFARATPLADVDAHPLTAGVQPFQGLSELLMTIMNLQGRSSFTGRPQTFWVDDPAATPLGHYAEDGRVAMALRERDGWTSVYLAAPNSLGPRLMHNLAVSAGAFTCGLPGPTIQDSGRFISLHALRNETYALRLPPGATRLLDADTGAALPLNNGVATLELTAGETVWLLVE